MTRSLAPFFSLLLSTAILLLGNGLFGTLVPIRGDLEGFSDASLGIIGAAYFAGFMLGSILCPYGIRRVGHIRSFAVFASLASAAPIIHVLSPDPILWGILRVMTGYCFAGLYTIIESWLNEQATNQNRGQLFGTYFVVNLAAITLGQLMLNLADPGVFDLFAIVAVLTSVALIPVSLTRSVQPAPIETIQVDIGALWRLSPVGMMGCFVVGLTNGPFWTLAPLYAQTSGLDVKGISFFMTAAILGGAVAQLPVGRLSDRVDRRWVLIGTLGGAAVASAFLAFANGHAGPNGLYLGSLVFGAFALSVYALCVAQTNDHAQPHQFVMIASGLLLVFSIGAVLGPLAVSLLLPYFGVGAVFGFSTAVYLPYIAFVFARIRVRKAVPQEEKEDFVAAPISRTGPAPIELDPRAEGLDTEEGAS